MIVITEIFWDNLPLRKESNRMSLFMHPYYIDALKKNVTNQIFNELKITAINTQNLIMYWFGTPGSGKSYSLMFVIEKFLSYYGMKTLNINNIFFRLADIFSAVRSSKEGDIFCLDEQVYTAGQGANIERMALSNIEQTVRIQRLSLFYSSPRLVSHVYKYRVETWEIGFTEPWDYDALLNEKDYLEKMWKYTKNVVFDNKDTMLGYFITGMPSNRQFLKEYENKKRNFVKNIVKMGGSGRQGLIMELAKSLLDSDDFLRKYILARSKRLKQLLIRIETEGILMGVEEMKTLVDYMEWLCEFDPAYIERYTRFIPQKKKRRF